MKDLIDMAQDEIAEKSSVENSEKNEEKTAEKNTQKTSKKNDNSVFEHENAEKNENSIFENEPKTDEENNLENALELEDFEDDFEDGEWEDEDEEEEDLEGEAVEDIEEAQTDTLDQYAQPATTPTTTIEDIKINVGGSEKNRKNLEKLGIIALNRADKIKAQICANLSGEHLAEYITDEETRDCLVEAIKEYLNSQNFKVPSPFWSMVFAFLMWGLPSFGLALWHKYENGGFSKKKTSKNLNQETTETEPKADYSNLKEYKDKRKIFSINKGKGTYNRTPKGTFIKIELADESPSPQVQTWIDEGKTNQEIRELLNYE